MIQQKRYQKIAVLVMTMMMMIETIHLYHLREPKIKLKKRMYM